MGADTGQLVLKAVVRHVRRAMANGLALSMGYLVFKLDTLHDPNVRCERSKLSMAVADFDLQVGTCRSLR
jgi:hypothetical protein